VTSESTFSTVFNRQHQSEIAVDVCNLHVTYPGHTPVLRGVNFSVQVGERVGLIGPNGAGKTTLFLAMCGVLKPVAGEVYLFNRSVLPGEFRPELGLVFQNPSDQLFCATVWDDVAFGVQNMGYSPVDVADRVQTALELTGVAELAKRPPHHLSGGQKRMVAIAGIIAMQPQVVLYDEPSANLDLRARRRLIEFLQQSRQNASKTTIISSHDLELLLEVCDRVLLIDGGCIVADGDPQTIMSDAPLMHQHGLEKPHSLLPHSDPHH